MVGRMMILILLKRSPNPEFVCPFYKWTPLGGGDVVELASGKLGRFPVSIPNRLEMPFWVSVVFVR